MPIASQDTLVRKDDTRQQCESVATDSDTSEQSFDKSRLLQAINRMQDEFIRQEEPQAAFFLLLETLLQITHSRSGFIGRIDNCNNGERQITFHSNKTPWEKSDPYVHAGPYPLEPLLLCRPDEPPSKVIRTGQPIISNNYAEEYSATYEFLPGLTIENIAALPLFSGKTMVGIVIILNREQGYNDNLIQDLKPLLSAAANMMESERQKALRIDAELALSDEERLRAGFVETAVDGIIAGDIEGNILEFNRAAERILGWRRDEAIGRKVGDILVPEDLRKLFYDKSHKYIAIEKLPSKGGHFETVTLHKDGHCIPVELAISATTVNNREIYISSVRDITDQKKHEQQLNEAIKQAESANKAKSDFVATVSHEIRTPLNAIRGGIGLLESAKLSKDELDLLHIMQDSTEVLMALVSDVLDFSKIEAGKIEIELLETYPRDILDSVMQLLAVRGFRNGVDVSGIVDPDVPEMVISDPGRLRQILINLLGNAIKFSPGSHVTARIKTCARPGLRYEIQDSGVGIPVRKQSELFTEFTRADSGASSFAGGTGLGLAISKRLVTLLGGDIGFTSTEGEGSSFWFEIPCKASDHTVRRSENMGIFSGLRILILGSERPWRAALGEQLAAYGIEVTCLTEDSTEELAKLASDETKLPDAIILSGFARNGDSIIPLVQQFSSQGTRLVVLRSSFGLMGIDRRLTNLADYSLRIPVLQKELVQCLVALTGKDMDDKTKKLWSTLSSTKPLNIPKGLRVLQAEDGYANRLVNELLLRHHGIQVDSVANGLEVVDTVTTLPYDVVLMDLNMPEMDGFEASQIIRSMKGSVRNIPIIAVTAHALKETAEKCKHAGMNECIVKPIDPEKLLASISRLAVNPYNHDSHGDEPRIESMHLQRLDRSVLDQLATNTSAKMMPKMIATFIEEMTDLTSSIKVAVNSQDMAALARESHLLKSTANTFGANRVGSLATELNQECKAGRSKEALQCAEHLLNEINLSTIDFTEELQNRL